MTLSPEAGREVRWWITNLYHSRKFLHVPPITIVIHSDASLTGWGATDSVSTVGAPWKDTDDLLHINVLELTAALLGFGNVSYSSSEYTYPAKIGQFDGYLLHKQNGWYPLSRMQPCYSTDLGMGGRTGYLAFCSVYSR